MKRRVLLCAALCLGCGATEKMLSAEGASTVRSAVREICAELERADRAASVYLDDGGGADAPLDAGVP